ncbi:MAG: dockerin type I repeat-containing protein [Planctomycetota bacterium]|nr:dockerin type I repeat-containing protein [Planctomycetota bacterium]
MPIDLPERLKAAREVGSAEEVAREPQISAEARAELKRAFARNLAVPPQMKLRVLAGAAMAFEDRQRRARSRMRTQRIAAAVLFLIGTAVAFKYMAPHTSSPITVAQNASKQKAEQDASQLALAEPSRAAGLMADERAPGAPAVARPMLAAPMSPAAGVMSTGVASNPFDLNHDGVVDVLDAYVLARTLEPLGGRVKAGSEALAKAGFSLADLNGDGFVDDLDVELIAARAVSLVPLASTGGSR